MNTLVLFECVREAEGKRRPREVRVWSRGEIVGVEWFSIENVSIDGVHRLRFDFPPDYFIRMPARLFLERPATPRQGAEWVLRGEDGARVEATFVQRDDNQLPLARVKAVESYYAQR